MPDKKPAAAAGPKGPDRASVDALMRVVNEGRKTQPKPPADETLPDDWGVGDLARVGVARVKHAIWGPPKSAAKGK